MEHLYFRIHDGNLLHTYIASFYLTLYEYVVTVQQILKIHAGIEPWNIFHRSGNEPPTRIC